MSKLYKKDLKIIVNAIHKKTNKNKKYKISVKHLINRLNGINDNHDLVSVFEVKTGDSIKSVKLFLTPIIKNEILKIKDATIRVITLKPEIVFEVKTENVYKICILIKEHNSIDSNVKKAKPVNKIPNEQVKKVKITSNQSKKQAKQKNVQVNSRATYKKTLTVLNANEFNLQNKKAVLNKIEEIGAMQVIALSKIVDNIDDLSALYSINRDISDFFWKYITQIEMKAKVIVTNFIFEQDIFQINNFLLAYPKCNLENDKLLNDEIIKIFKYKTAKEKSHVIKTAKSILKFQSKKITNKGLIHIIKNLSLKDLGEISRILNFKDYVFSLIEPLLELRNSIAHHRLLSSAFTRKELMENWAIISKTIDDQEERKIINLEFKKLINEYM